MHLVLLAGLRKSSRIPLSKRFLRPWPDHSNYLVATWLLATSHGPQMGPDSKLQSVVCMKA